MRKQFLHTQELSCSTFGVTTEHSGSFELSPPEQKLTASAPIGTLPAPAISADPTGSFTNKPSTIYPGFIAAQPFPDPAELPLPPKTFVNEMQQLISMGFANRDVNERLLTTHKGDVQQCVLDLISLQSSS